MVIDVLTRILQKANRPMTIQEIKQHVLKQKMISPSTIMINLHKEKERFIKDDNGYYIISPKWKDIPVTNSDARRKRTKKI